MRDDEIQILIKYGQRPNIITVKDIFIQTVDDQMMIYLVTELMAGGEMFHKIQRQKSLCEREASSVMKTVASTGTMGQSFALILGKFLRLFQAYRKIPENIIFVAFTRNLSVVL